MNKMNLSGKTILITRPARQAALLAEKIRACGGNSIIFPTLEIVPLLNLPPLPSSDIAIFVSANAVEHAPRFSPENFSTRIVIAVGTGTARALGKKGVKTDYAPAPQNTEGILALPILQSISAKKIVIFCGENSRPLLKQTLQSRGAFVTEAVCYRRQCPTVSRAMLKNLQKSAIHCIISTSSESLTNLVRLYIPCTPDELFSIPLLVISPAMADQAEQLGFQTILLSSGAGEQAICAALTE